MYKHSSIVHKGCVSTTGKCCPASIYCRTSERQAWKGCRTNHCPKEGRYSRANTLFRTTHGHWWFGHGVLKGPIGADAGQIWQCGQSWMYSGPTVIFSRLRVLSLEHGVTDQGPRGPIRRKQFVSFPVVSRPFLSSRNKHGTRQESEELSKYTSKFVKEIFVFLGLLKRKPQTRNGNT